MRRPAAGRRTDRHVLAWLARADGDGCGSSQVALVGAADPGRGEERLAPLRAALTEELVGLAVAAVMFGHSAETAMPLLQAEGSAERDTCSWPACRVSRRGSMRCCHCSPRCTKHAKHTGQPRQGAHAELSGGHCQATPPLLHTGLGFAEEQAQVRYTLRCNGGPDARTVLSCTEHCVS